MSAKTDKIAGHAKSVAGAIADDKNLEAKGKAQTRLGETEAHIDAAKDKLSDVVDDLSDKVEAVAEKAKGALKDR